MIVAALALITAAWGTDDRSDFLTWVDELEAVELGETSAGYRTAAEVFDEVALAIGSRPDVQVERIGTSEGGRPLWAFHLSAHGASERSVLVFGGIHALEWISVEVATEVLLDALVHPAGASLTVIPLLNPDGRAKVERDLEAGLNAYRRGNEIHVDLNRDFAVHRDCVDAWQPIIPRRHGTTREALSAPETRALDGLAAREQYDRAASLHAFGGFFYYPWSGRWDRPDDHAEFVAIGRAMQAAQGARAYKVRQLSRWGFFFRAHGTEIDHLYGAYGTRAFLVELTRSGIRPLRFKDYGTYFRWYNPVDKARHVAKGVAAMRALMEVDP